MIFKVFSILIKYFNLHTLINPKKLFISYPIRYHNMSIRGIKSY